MRNNNDCEFGIDCNKCKSRGMCMSYANHMYSVGLMQGKTDREDEILNKATDILKNTVLKDKRNWNSRDLVMWLTELIKGYEYFENKISLK